MSRPRRNAGPKQSPGESRYDIQLTRAAERGLAALPKADIRRVDAKIQALAENPRPSSSKKLKGVDDLYRARSGDYRILYQIEDRRLVVVVVNVGNRRDVYDSL